MISSPDVAAALTGLGLGGFIIAVTFLATVDWIHPGPYNAPRKDPPVRALTVRQPWAAAIAHGGKRIENRARPIPPKHLGSTVLIHAGAAEDLNALPADTIRDWTRHFSAIVAVATLADCHQAARPRCCAPWGFPDTWHWVLEDVRALPHPPRPVRGQLGLWTVSDDVLAAVNRQVYITERFGL